MPISSRELRLNSIQQTNIEKIINLGIRYHLKKLEHCLENISKYKENGQLDNLQRECMNGRLLMQQLELNLGELEKCYAALQSDELQRKYSSLVSLIKDEATIRMESFRQVDQSEKIKPIAMQNEVSFSKDPELERSKLQTQVEVIKFVESKDRLCQVQSLQQDIEELNSLAIDMAAMVGEQGKVVDSIETNVSEAKENIDEGTRTLIKASASTIAPITCAALGGVTFGPVGAILGFKLSTGIISALGASAATYSVAKYLQNKHKDDCRQDMKSIDKQ